LKLKLFFVSILLLGIRGWAQQALEAQVLAAAGSSDAIGNSFTIGEALPNHIDGNLNLYNGFQASLLSYQSATVSLTDSSPDSIVKGGEVIEITATFSTPMQMPTLQISNLVSPTSMTVSASSSSKTWTYSWVVSSSYDGVAVATVSATDYSGTPYSGTESITYTVDNVAPQILNATLAADNLSITLELSEPLYGNANASPTLTDFDLQIYNGVASLTSQNPISLTSVSSLTNSAMSYYYTLGISFNGTPSGSEIVKVQSAYSESNFANWSTGEPTGSQPYVFMDSNGKWFDHSESLNDEGYGLYEFDSIVTQVASHTFLGTWNGHSYFMSNDITAGCGSSNQGCWTVANSNAPSGSYLLVINSSEEQHFISQKLQGMDK